MRELEGLGELAGAAVSSDSIGLPGVRPRRGVLVALMAAPLLMLLTRLRLVAVLGGLGRLGLGGLSVVRLLAMLRSMMAGA